MIPDNSISFIIPALNEEARLEATVNTIFKAVENSPEQPFFDFFEILIFDDGSTDSTPEVADALAKRYKNIRVWHHRSPKNLGGVFRQGLKKSRMKYVMLINGKNDIEASELVKIFRHTGDADMIIPYQSNNEERSWFRRAVSKMFTNLMNTLFGLNLKYYNHSVVYKRCHLSSIILRTDSYAFQAEALVKLIRSGHTYTSVDVIDRFEKGISTKAFKPKNLMGVARFLTSLLYDIYFRKQYSRRLFNSSRRE
jgi:glycosyltransferase involved in cell wall biosynthesis